MRVYIIYIYMYHTYIHIYIICIYIGMVHIYIYIGVSICLPLYIYTLYMHVYVCKYIYHIVVLGTQFGTDRKQVSVWPGSSWPGAPGQARKGLSAYVDGHEGGGLYIYIYVLIKMSVSISLSLYIYIHMLTSMCLDPKSTHNNGPKPLKRAQQASCLTYWGAGTYTDICIYIYICIQYMYTYV